MTKEEAKLRILGFHNEIKIGDITEDIFLIIDKIEDEETTKWKKEAERLNTIIEWLREQCLDPALIR